MGRVGVEELRELGGGGGEGEGVGGVRRGGEQEVGSWEGWGGLELRS